jgi:Trk K+ transport system NAD-binding subunit
MKSELKEFHIPISSSLDGKAVFELGLPEGFLIIHVTRDSDLIVSGGATVLRGGDLIFSDLGLRMRNRILINGLEFLSH